jgi:mannosyltransferase OCH1-like enzyme
MSIPHIFVQTSRIKPPSYVVAMIQKHIPDWIYMHYDDAEIIHFFQQHPLPEMPDIIEKFYSFRYGEHRADLFRYYFLYIYGGVYMDCDAIMLVDINNIVREYSFFSVESSYFVNTIFQGFIGCAPAHPIIYQALLDIYNTPIDDTVKDFHLFCRNLFTFYNEDTSTDKRLYNEIKTHDMYASIYDMETNTELGRHYYADKIIPIGLVS